MAVTTCPLKKRAKRDSKNRFVAITANSLALIIGGGMIKVLVISDQPTAVSAIERLLEQPRLFCFHCRAEQESVADRLLEIDPDFCLLEAIENSDKELILQEFLCKNLRPFALIEKPVLESICNSDHWVGFAPLPVKNLVQSINDLSDWAEFQHEALRSPGIQKNDFQSPSL